MSSKNMRSCPNCGSEELFREADHRKGIIFITCEECDHKYEVHEIVISGRSSRPTERRRESGSEMSDGHEESEDD